ncbi:MAG: 50S ribosomal protein L25 [Verrucomicrobiae bacterium]|nr:50S ribosomal protein L25 [Verrucomicrobiae bacterium]
MKPVALKVQLRTRAGRGGARSVRRNGRIPAVIYGRNTTPQNVEINAHDFEKLVQHTISENLLLDLTVEGDARPKRLALVREVQHHPLTGRILHIDLHEITETEKVTVYVPVETVGEAIGVKTGGGVLEHLVFKLRVRALPKDLPDVITLDVSHLNVGQAIHIGDITPPPGTEILGDKSIAVVAVAAPRAEEEAAAAPAEAAAPGEVEMIKEKKEAAEAEGAEAGQTEKAEKAAAKAAAKAADKAAGAEKAQAEKAAEKKK